MSSAGSVCPALRQGAAGIHHANAHTALADARATATLLAGYLDPTLGIPPLPGHRAVVAAGTRVVWPTAAGSGRIADPSAEPRQLSSRARRKIAAAPPRMETLLETFTHTDAVHDGAPAGTLAYLETLVGVLEDGQISADEADALDDIVEAHELDADAVAAAHCGFVRALAREALEDGVLSRAERAELRQTAALLDVPEGRVADLLDGEEEARLAGLSAGLAPLPAGWRLGEALRVGQRVAFTGCDELERDILERRAAAAGVRVTGSVSRRTAMLVTDGSIAGTKAAAATALGTRTVHPRDFAVFLDHIQPHLGADAAAPTIAAAAAVPVPRRPASPGAERGGASPSDVRAWARRNGYEVGARGRLPADVWEAYRLAQH